MGWEALIPIIAEYGIPLAESLYQKWASGNPPTQADFDELKTQAQQKAQDRMSKALAAAGIPLDSDAAKKLLALTM